MIVDELLDTHSPCEKEFISWLNENPADIPPSSVVSAPVEDVAIWGLSDDEWLRSVLTARIMQLSSRVSSRCPVFSIVSVAMDSDSMRTQFWSGSSLLPGVMEDKVGCNITQHDEQAMSELLHILPTGWSLVIEGRGQRR